MFSPSWHQTKPTGTVSYHLILGPPIPRPKNIPPQAKERPLAELIPHPPEKDVSKAEGRIPVDYGSDAVEVPGSRKLLDRLSSVNAPWAIVTSGTTPLVTGWLDVMKLAQPKHMVTAEEVEHGKPDPACYRLGAKRLGFEDTRDKRILVLEDAPAGVRAGKAAGFDVLGLVTTHSFAEMQAAGADWIVPSLENLDFIGFQTGTGRIKIKIRDALWE
jgi:glycerol 3-phosphatase-1